MTSDDDAYRRRTVLKGAATAGLGAVGMSLTAGSGAAQPRQGGSGLVRASVYEAHAEDEFLITERLGSQNITCRGNERTWACYRIEFVESGDEATLFVNPNRRIKTGREETHEFTGASLACQDEEFVQTAFKPATDNQGGR